MVRPMTPVRPIAVAAPAAASGGTRPFSDIRNCGFVAAKQTVDPSPHRSQ